MDLLKLKVNALYKFLVKNKIEIRFIIINWFFTLGLNHISLNMSGVFLKRLIYHGWYFFYKFLLAHFSSVFKLMKK